MESEVLQKGKAAKEAAYILADATTAAKNKALSLMADSLLAHEEDVLAANAKDIAKAREKGMSSAMIDRLTLTR